MLSVFVSLARNLSLSEISTARTIEKFAGNIMSFCLPLGSIVKLTTKNLCYLIESRSRWDSPLVLTPPAKVEINFWLQSILLVPTRRLLSYQLPESIIFSDANNTGCGAILKSLNCKCFRPLNLLEQEESSTSRELRSVLFAFQSFRHQIDQKSVLLLTDNQACAKIIESGSMKPHLQKLALKIFAFSICNATNLDARWIPRDFNTEADALSKTFESDDWAVRPLFFRHFDRLWGPYTVDRFADQFNAQLPSFNSRFYCPGNSGVDAFSFDWSNAANNWLVPPVHLIVRSVKHLIACKAKGTLVCPKWPSPCFWPALFPFGTPAPFIKGMIEISAGSSLFLPSSQPTSIFNKPNFPSPILFIRIHAQLL